MSIEVGALALRIAEVGGQDVMSKLALIDRKATEIGAKPITARVGAPGARQATNELDRLALAGQKARMPVTIPVRIDRIDAAQRALSGLDGRIRTLAQGLQFDSTRANALQRLTAFESFFARQLRDGNAPLQTRIALESQLATVRKALASTAPTIPSVPTPPAAAFDRGTAAVGAYVGQLKSLIPVLGATALVSGTLSVLRESSLAYDQAAAASRRLEATAKITGVALEQLRAIQTKGQAEFLLSTASAADYAIELAKLASKAGDVGSATPALRAFLDLGAARGLTAAETLQAVQQAILGIDEGTDKLFNANPSVLYDQFARSIGTTAGKLTEAQKAQAILTAALRDGAKVQGEYAKFLETAAGKASQFEQASTRAKTAIGGLFSEMRSGLAERGTAFLNWIADVVTKLDQMNVRLGQIIPRVAGMIPGVGAVIDYMIGLDRGEAAPAASAGGRRAGPPNPAVRRAPITITGQRETAAEKEAREAAEKREAARVRELAALATIAKLQKTTLPDLERAAQLERALTRELERGNVTRVRRAELLEQLQNLRESGALLTVPDIRDPLERPTRGGARKLTINKASQRQLLPPAELYSPLRESLDEVLSRLGQDATLGTSARAALEKIFTQATATSFVISPDVVLNTDALGQAAAAVDAQFANLGANLSQVLGSAIATGFAGGDVGQAVLQGLGTIFMQMGQSLLTYGATMIGLLPTLANPFLSGPAALAAGAALLALGGTLGGIATGKGGGGSAPRFAGYGSAAGSSLTLTIADAQVRRATTPVSAAPTVRAIRGTPVAPASGPVITVIGADSPQGQRIIGTANAHFQRRGGV